jgi:hypothetical protein
VAAEARRARITLRQLVLFVLSMVVPSIVLLTLGVRIIVQQEELTEKHLLDQQRLRANEFERALSKGEGVEQSPRRRVPLTARRL